MNACNGEARTGYTTLKHLAVTVYLLSGAGSPTRGDIQEVYRLPEVLVTATGIATDPHLLPYITHTLTATELLQERLVRTIPEALDETPSVMVQKTAYGQGSPYIRGFTGFRTLLLVDGIRLNNSTFRDGPNQYWNTVDPCSVQRLELVKGPSSVLYGSDAIGGTVNAITLGREGYGDGFDWNPTTYYRFASAEDSHTGRGAVTAHAGDSRGVAVGATVKSYGDLRAGDSTGVQPRTGYAEWDADAKIEYRIDADRLLVAAWQHVDQDDAWRTHRTIYAKSFHGTSIGTDLVHLFDQNRDLAYLQWHATNLAGAVESVSLSGSYQFQGEKTLRVRSNGVREESAVDVHTAGLWLRLVSPSPLGRWTSGAEYYRDFVGSHTQSTATNGTVTKAIQGPVADDASYDLVGVYIQDEIPLGERVDLILGGRYTYARADAGRVREPVTGLATALADDWHSAVGNARVSWQVDAADHWRLFAGASQGFRAPNLSDLTRLDVARSGEIETAGLGLDPEEFLALETGVKLRYDSFSAELAYYHTLIQHMIVRQPTGAIVNGANEVTKRNASDGFVHGVEAQATWRFPPRLEAFGWIAWMAGEGQGYPTAVPTRREEYISRLMPLTGEVGLRWNLPSPRLWFEVVMLMADSQTKLSASDKGDTQRIPPGGTPGYVVLAARGGWQVHRNLTVTAALENIGNTDYRVHGSGLNEPGRNAVVAATVAF